MGGIKLKGGDRVVAADIASAADRTSAAADKRAVAAISTEGYARRTALKDFPVQGRNGQGVQAKMQKSAGNIAGAVLVSPDAGLLAAALTGGGTKRLALSAFAQGGRTAAGKAAVMTVAGDTVIRLILLPAGVAPAEPPRTGRTPKAQSPNAPAKTSTRTAKAAAPSTGAKGKTVAKPVVAKEQPPTPKPASPRAAKAKDVSPATSNLFGPLPPIARAEERPENEVSKRTRSPHPRGTPEAGSMPRATGQLSFDDTPPEPPKGRGKRGK
jgi:hypothetical protein